MEFVGVVRKWRKWRRKVAEEKEEQGGRRKEQTILSRIVAPSFVMVTSPSGLTSILSRPLGPRDVRSV